MSRIGKHPVPIPAGVEAKIMGKDVQIKGKKGTLSYTVHGDVDARLEDGKIVVKPVGNSALARTLWPTTRTRIANMVKGVTDGFSRELEIQGVGYRAALKGKTLVLQLGFSHDIEYPIPAGIEIKSDKPTSITIHGADKQQVGQVAAELRSYRSPEPYKGKGVRYLGEDVRRKEGKKK